MTILRPPPGESNCAYRLRVAKQLLQLYRGRDDHIGVAHGAKFCPEVLAQSLTPERLAMEHLGGERCLALYLMLPDSTVLVSCLDIDNKPHRPDPQWQHKAETVYRLLVDHGLAAVVEISQSGSAAHIWIFFEAPIPAWLVRAFWLGVLSALRMAVPEIYPRQDRLTGKGLGNMVRYPLWLSLF